MEMFPTRLRPRRRLLLFARVPQRGHVKSRLARAVGEEAALELYEAMLGDILERLDELQDDISVEILWTADDPVDSSTLQRIFGERELCRQTGAHLGERLQMAFSERIFFHEAESVIAIGVDDPGLEPTLIRQSFDLLDSCEWVIGPATDGGYWLIGCRGAAFKSAVFRDVEWGTPGVFATTLHAIRSLQTTVAILPQRRDIDEIADLRDLHRRGRLPVRTRRVADHLVPPSDKR